jgi:hypothetical protein
VICVDWKWAAQAAEKEFFDKLIRTVGDRFDSRDGRWNLYNPVSRSGTYGNSPPF